MEDPDVPFADTTARRAQLMEATERFKSSIETEVKSMKNEAQDLGKTAALVAGVALGVFIVANAIIPKSPEYRYAEKYGERDDDDKEEEYDTDYDEDDDRPLAVASPVTAKKITKESQKSGAKSGIIAGLVTTILTNLAREQLSGLLTRITQNNAINPAAKPTEAQFHAYAPTQPVSYDTNP